MEKQKKIIQIGKEETMYLAEEDEESEVSSYYDDNQKESDRKVQPTDYQQTNRSLIDNDKLKKKGKNQPVDFLEAEKRRIMAEGMRAPQQIDFNLVKPGQNLNFLQPKKKKLDHDVFQIDKKKAKTFNPNKGTLEKKKGKNKSTAKKNRIILDKELQLSDINPNSPRMDQNMPFDMQSPIQ